MEVFSSKKILLCVPLYIVYAQQPTLEKKELETSCYGRLAKNMIFLGGIYLSLNVIDKLEVQEVGFSKDIVSPVMLALYALLAPVLFFLPLWAPHNAMLKKKQSFIEPVCQQLEDSINDIKHRNKCDESKITLVTKLREERLNLLKQIPVWPFDIRSLNACFGAVIMPVVPTVLPFIVNAISNM